MTEHEAAGKLADLLNEIQAAGHYVEPSHDGTLLFVGARAAVAVPQSDDSVWEVRR